MLFLATQLALATITLPRSGSECQCVGWLRRMQ